MFETYVINRIVQNEDIEFKITKEDNIVARIKEYFSNVLFIASLIYVHRCFMRLSK